MPSAVLHPLVCGTSLNSLGLIQYEGWGEYQIYEYEYKYEYL